MKDFRLVGVNLKCWNIDTKLNRHYSPTRLQGFRNDSYILFWRRLKSELQNFTSFQFLLEKSENFQFFLEKWKSLGFLNNYTKSWNASKIWVQGHIPLISSGISFTLKKSTLNSRFSWSKWANYSLILEEFWRVLKALRFQNKTWFFALFGQFCFTILRMMSGLRVLYKISHNF